MNYSNLDIRYMHLTLKLANLAFLRNEIPVAAIIVLNDKIISSSFNQVEKQKNPLAHAEIIAINKAISKINSKYLNDATIYVNLEPCAMCSGAIVNSRIKRLVFAAFDIKAGGSGSLFNITCSKELNHRLNITSGVLETESKNLLNRFFKKIRSK